MRVLDTAARLRYPLLWWGVVFALLAWVSPSDASQADGKKYSISAPGGPWGSADEACQAFYAASGEPKAPYYINNPHVEDVTATSFACKGDWRQSDGNGGYVFWFEGGLATGSISACVAGDELPGGPCAPPPPQVCEQDAPEVGKTFSGTASSMATRSYCHAVNHCRVEVKQSVSAGGTTIYTGTVTRDECPEDGSAPQVAADDLSESEACVAVGDGSYCASPKAGDGSCGFVNSSFVCLAKVKQDECKPVGGGAVCGAAAGTPPVPDTGTRGQPAMPTGSFQGQTGGGQAQTFNYFNSTTVSSSSVSGGDGGNPQDSGGSPGGNAEEEQEEQGSASGGVGCDAPPVCTGDAIACATLYQAWRNRCPGSFTEAEVHAAVGDPPGWNATGVERDMGDVLDDSKFGTAVEACPAPPVITLGAPLNMTFTLDVITWLCMFAGQISGVVVGLSWLLSARILMGAV